MKLSVVKEKKAVLAMARAFRRWATATIPRRPLNLFRIGFASVWLIYDLLDLGLGGTKTFFWSSDVSVHQRLAQIQIALVIIETSLLLGWQPRWMAFFAFLARYYETRFLALNDFFYYCAIALILSQVDFKKTKTWAWPREVLILQTAWIYFATALLKLNPSFLSGGDLFVRQNYLAYALDWPYPPFYAQWISGLTGNAILSWLGVISEFTLSGALFGWWLLPRWRSLTRPLAIGIALVIHIFGALSLNVFFFGVSMMVQIVTLTETGGPILVPKRKKRSL